MRDATKQIGTPGISVVVPLYNEAGNVLPLASRIFAALGEDPRGLELILVDDCSSDETWTRIIEAVQKDTRVRGLRHSTNLGQSAALWTGFKASRGGVIATLDGDLQNDPADFAGMLTQLEGCDMVCGMRTKRADTLVRRISSRIARRARRLALRTDFVDTGCNLRVFKRSVLETLPAFDGIHRFMPILALNGGALVREVPVRHHPRASGVSKYGVWNRLGRGIRDLVMVGLFLRRQLKTLGSATIEYAASTGTGEANPRGPGETPAPRP
jgi:dolichol-phosphate mannosyltransferase